MQFEQIYTQKPEQIPEFFAKAWNRKNAVELANLFVEDAEFVNVVGLWWHNRRAIWQAHDYGLKVIFPESTIEVQRVKVRMLAEGIALVHAKMRLTGQSAFGDVKEAGARQNLFSFIVQRKENGWVCVSAHNTDIISGKETNIVNDLGEISSVDYRKK